MCIRDSISSTHLPKPHSECKTVITRLVHKTINILQPWGLYVCDRDEGKNREIRETKLFQNRQSQNCTFKVGFNRLNNTYLNIV